MNTPQQYLFERAPTYKKVETPASHRADPDTSRVAEDFVTKTGIRASQQQRTIDAVRAHHGKTSAELAQLVTKAGEDEAEIRTMLARRLSECATAGAVRRGVVAVCAVKGRKCVTWWSV